MPLAGDDARPPDLRVSGEPRRDGSPPSARQRYVHVGSTSCKPTPRPTDLCGRLEEVAARGVTVRVLMDHWANRASRSTADAEAPRRGQSAVALMLPVRPSGKLPAAGPAQPPQAARRRRSRRIHGLANMTASTSNLHRNIQRALHWVDLMVHVEGPVVASVDAVFLSDWYSNVRRGAHRHIGSLRRDTGPRRPRLRIVPSGPGFEFENDLRLFLGLMYYAAQGHRRQSVLRSRRSSAQCDHDGMPPGSARGAFRLRGGGSGGGLPRAAQLLRSAAARRGQDLDVPRNPSSCTSSR